MPPESDAPDEGVYSPLVTVPGFLGYPLTRWVLMGGVALAVFSAVIGILNLTLYLTDDESNFDPLYGPGYEMPRIIDGDSRLFRPGDEVVVTTTICTKETVGLYGVTILRHLGPGPRLSPIDLRSGASVREEGCHDTVTVYVLPAGIPPGDYEITGTTTATAHGEESTRVWASEPFEVVE